MEVVGDTFFTDRIRRMGEGNVFSLFTGGGVPTPRYLPSLPANAPTPQQVRMGGGVTPRYIPPCPGQDRGQGGTPRYLNPPPPTKVPTPPGQDGGRGTSKYLPPILTRGRWGTPSPGIGQHMEYLIYCGRFASCDHEGGLSCSTYNRTCFHFCRNVNAYYEYISGSETADFPVSWCIHTA